MPFRSLLFLSLLLAPLGGLNAAAFRESPGVRALAPVRVPAQQQWRVADRLYRVFRWMHPDLNERAARTNGWAVASFSCGLISLALPAALVFGPLAVLFGIIGWSTVHRRHNRAKGLAIAGLILGAVCFAALLAGVGIYYK